MINFTSTESLVAYVQQNSPTESFSDLFFDSIKQRYKVTALYAFDKDTDVYKHIVFCIKHPPVGMKEVGKCALYINSKFLVERIIPSIKPKIEFKQWQLVKVDIISFEPSWLKLQKKEIELKPKWLVDEIRFDEVRQAIDRYLHDGRQIPIEWIEEYNQLLPTNQKYVKHER